MEDDKVKEGEENAPVTEEASKNPATTDEAEPKDTKGVDAATFLKRVHARRRSVSANDLLRLKTETQQVTEMVPPSFVQERVKLWGEITGYQTVMRPTHSTKSLNFSDSSESEDSGAPLTDREGKRGSPRKMRNDKIDRDASAPVPVRKKDFSTRSVSDESARSPNERVFKTRSPSLGEIKVKRSKSLSRGEGKVRTSNTYPPEFCSSPSK